MRNIYQITFTFKSDLAGVKIQFHAKNKDAVLRQSAIIATVTDVCEI